MNARGDSLGQRIRRAYVDAGLNRSQFQRALGVAYSTVLMWERDRTRPNADNLRLIGEITGKPVDGLLLSSTLRAAKLDGGRRYPDVMRQFLAKPGRKVTDAEKRTLESVVFHHMRPTPEALEAMLQALRCCEEVRAQSKKD